MKVIEVSIYLYKTLIKGTNLSGEAPKGPQLSMIISGGDRRLRPQLSMNMPPIVHAQKCFGYRNLDFSRRTGPQIVGPKLLFQIGEMHDLIM